MPFAEKEYKWTHKTLEVFPHNIVGYNLRDEEPGFTGIYARDAEGGLWPARTVDFTSSHYHSVCNAWLNREGSIDERKTKPA
jgi:hypothetical protein